VTPAAGPDLETIGERLKRLRLVRGLSQRDLSAPGCSYAYVSRVEAGLRYPSIRVIRHLASRLGVSPEYLETGSQMTAREGLELRLADAELELRLGDAAPEAAALDALIVDARALGEEEIVARALAVSGLAAFAAGAHSRSVELLEEARRSSHVTPLVRPDVFKTLGRALALLGRLDESIALFEQCLASVSAAAQTDGAARMRYASCLSAALSDAGRIEEAREALESALEDETATDVHSQVTAYWSLARLATLEGAPLAGLEYVRRAIGLLRATDDTFDLARAHVAYAQILMLAGRYEEAGKPLRRAERLFELGGNAYQLGLVRTEQAKRAARLGEHDAALAGADEALDYLRESPHEHGGAHWARALALAGLGRGTEAEATFAQAVELLEGAHEDADAAAARHDWAALLTSAGRESAAAAVLERVGAPA
jgi:tetratricopeptide (TPR) repeat protein